MASDMVERVARAICARHAMYDADMIVVGRSGESVPYWTEFVDDTRAAIEAMREPTEAMVRATVMQTDHGPEHLDFGASVVEGMPPLAPHRQRDGIEAAADVYRDWQSMIDAALQESSHD